MLANNNSKNSNFRR